MKGQQQSQYPTDVVDRYRDSLKGGQLTTNPRNSRYQDNVELCERGDDGHRNCHWKPRRGLLFLSLSLIFLLGVSVMRFFAYSCTSRVTLVFSGGAAGVVKRDFEFEPPQKSDPFQKCTYWAQVSHVTSFSEALICSQLMSFLSSLQYSFPFLSWEPCISVVMCVFKGGNLCNMGGPRFVVPMHKLIPITEMRLNRLLLPLEPSWMLELHPGSLEIHLGLQEVHPATLEIHPDSRRVVEVVAMWFTVYPEGNWACTLFSSTSSNPLLSSTHPHQN